MPTTTYIFNSQGGNGITTLFENLGAAAEAWAKKVRNGSDQSRASLRLLNQTLKEIHGTSSDLTGVLGPVGRLLSSLGPAGVAAGAGLGAVATGYLSALKAGREFDKQISQLSAITGATGKDLAFLRGEATALARATTIGATQVAEAFKLIASAKPELLSSGEALAVVTKHAITLAEASGQQLPEAARALTTALNQFGAGANQAGRFINVLAAGAQKGAVEIPDLTIALVKAGTEARGAGLSFEQTVAIVEELGKFGTPLEKIGTSLRNIFLRLQAGADETNPALQGWEKALDNLAAKQLSTLELTKLFGEENITVARQMLAVRDSAKDLTGEITNTNTALEQAHTATDNLDGDITRLKNAWNAWNVEMGGSPGLLRETIQWATNFINTMNGDSFQQAVRRLSTAQNFTRFAGTVGPDGSTVPAPTPAQRQEADAAWRSLFDLTVGSAEATFAPRQFVGPPERPPADVAREEQLLGQLAGIDRRVEDNQKKKADKIDEQRKKDLATLKQGFDAALLTEEEYNKRRVDINADADKRIAEERAKAAKAGLAAAKAAANDQAQIEKTLRDLENDRIQAGLKGVEKIRAEERARFAELEVAFKKAHASEAQLAQLRSESEAREAARVAAFQKEQADKVDEVIRNFEGARATVGLTGVEKIRAEERERFDDAEARLKDLGASEEQYNELREASSKSTTDRITEYQREQFAGVATEISGLLSSGLVEGFLAGKDAAFDWGDAVLGIVKRIAADVAQAFILENVVGPLFGVQTRQASGNASGLGSGIVSLLVGGGGGGSVLSSAVTGNSDGGLLGGLLSRITSGGGSSIPSTGGTPTLLQRGLSSLFGGGASALSGFTGPTVAALDAAQAAHPLALSVGTVVPPPVTGTFTPGVGGATSGASLVAAYAGLAISLGLAAKGLIDDREAIDKVTLGTGNRTKNTLTGLGAGLIAGGAAGGAAIGTAVYPGIGTVVGAGVGAAVGSALSQAINAGVAKGTAEGVRGGLDQAGLNKAIASKLSDDLILNILSGGANKAFVADILGPAVAPSIERIFSKVFRQAIGGPGGLNTEGVTGGGLYGLGANRAQAAQISRIIANSFGAGGDAFGSEREGNFVSILLGGIKKRLAKEGGDAAEALAQVFATTFNGKFLNVAATIFKERKGLREGDLRFAAEQFAKGSPIYDFDYQRVVNDILEGERVPGRAARKRSRETFDQAFQASVGAPGDPFAFQRSVTGSFTSFAAEQFSSALSKSSLGIGFADIFAPDKDERRALRRARRGKGGEDEINILVSQFTENVGELANVLKDPAYPKAISAFTDEIFKLGVKVAESTGDMLGARVQIEQKLGPYTSQVAAIDQLQRDVNSRTKIALAGPGFEASRAQIELLEQRRRDTEEILANDRQAFTGITDLRRQQAGEAGASLIQRSLRNVAAFGFIPPDLRDQARQELTDFADARLQELEAEIALQRQIVDLLEQAKEQVRGIRQNAEQLLGTFDSRAEVARQFREAQDTFGAARGLGFEDPTTLNKFVNALANAVTAAGARLQFFQGASDQFTDLADSLDLQLGGRRVGRRLLAARRTELASFLPAALAGGAGAENAIAQVQKLIPETLDLARNVLSPGALRRLTRELSGTARSLGLATGTEADVARDQLTALQTIAEQAQGGVDTALGDANQRLTDIKDELVEFREDISPLLAYLGGAARTTLSSQLTTIAGLLGPDGGALSVLRAIANKFQIPGYANGSPLLSGGDVSWVGERGPELFVAPRAGRVVPIANRAGTTVVNIGGNGPLVVVNQTLPPGATAADASLYRRSAVDGLEAQIRAILKRVA